MPLYEYECTKCHHRFEVIQKFSDPPKTECPECKGPVKKLLSAPAIQFKGTGWYVTDYGGKSGGGASSSHHKGKEVEAKKDDPAPAGGTKDKGPAKKD